MTTIIKKKKMKEIRETEPRRPNLWALSPLILFLCLYVVTAVVAKDFYAVPITVAFATSSAFAIVMTKGISLSQRIDQYSKGAGNPNIMLMIWIFVMAGAFAQSAKSMGAVDATVQATLHLMPESMLLPGLFIAACFISLSIGTSVGTIVALTPVAAGIASQTGGDTAMVVAIVVGGAFFGDNLSFISDTTIVATQTMGCEMKDKFKANIFIVLPAAIAVLVYYSLFGGELHSPASEGEIEWLKVLPYMAVLVTAIIGLNVMVVLAIGIILAGIVGISLGSYNAIGYMGSMGDGIIGMGELIIVTMMAGGMLELIRFNGGISYITSKLSKQVSGKRSGSLCIAALVMISDFCTANNTVAIVTVGPIAKQIADKCGLTPKKAASILDTFSCFAQGLIPYGAQVLMASGLSQVSSVDIISHLYYPFGVGICATIACLMTKKP